MRTPIQTVLDKLNEHKEYYGQRFPQLETWLESELEYEKVTIRDAFDSGWVRGSQKKAIATAEDYGRHYYVTNFPGKSEPEP